MLGSASAMAQDHTDAALDFIQHATVNNWATPCSIDWTSYSGTTKAACFFTLSLMRANNYTNLDIFFLWDTAAPSSGDYFNLINMSPIVGSAPPPIETHFRKVTTATAIERGDILSIGATDTYSGHTMIITGPATEITALGIQPRYSGTKQWAVPIVDSTNTSHGCNPAFPDNRWSGPCSGGTMHPGAGTATVRLYTDALTGVLLGYTWSVTASTTSYYSPSTRPYRIGRLYKLPPPEPVGDPPPPP
jgi:hypothetical protein